jgi:hypothetical protein
MLGFVIFTFVGCGKERTLGDRVTLKQEKVQIGEVVKIEDLFSCEDDVTIGIKNSNEFNVNKAGTYAVEVVIDREGEQETKNFMIEVVDEVAPEIKLKKDEITIYEGDKLQAQKYAKASDNSGEDITVEVAENNVDTSKAGSYIIKYNAQDSAGNESNAQLKVTVKKNYSYLEVKKIAKKILKKKNYNRLSMSTDSTKKIVYCNIKDKYYFSSKRVKGDLFSMNPYVSLSKEKKQWSEGFHVFGYLSSAEEYVKPGKCYFTSSAGEVQTTSWSYETSYDSGYVECYDVDFQFSFDTKDTEKMNNVLKGKNVRAVNYENVTNAKYTYKYSKEQMKSLKQLSEFCDEIGTYF